MKIDKSKIWKYGEWALVILVIIVLAWKFFFQPIDSRNKDLYNQLSKNNEERIKDVQSERQAQIDSKQLILDKINSLEEQIQAYQSALNESKQVLKNIDAKIKNLPDRINQLANNKDSLRRAAIEE